MKKKLLSIITAGLMYLGMAQNAKASEIKTEPKQDDAMTLAQSLDTTNRSKKLPSVSFNLRGYDMLNFNLGVSGSYSITPKQKLIVDYHSNMIQSKLNTSSKGFNLASLKYQLKTTENSRASNTFTLAGGLLNRFLYDEDVLCSYAKNINSALLGLSDSLSASLVKGDEESLDAHIRASLMGQITNREHLDYGMKSFNWDSFDISLGLDLNRKLSPSINIQNKVDSCFEKNNSDLYFFTDTSFKNRLSTILDFGNISVSHMLKSNDLPRERELSSIVGLAFKNNRLKISGEVEHSYEKHQLNNHGVNLNYKDDESLFYDVGWICRTIGDKIVNNQFYVGLNLALGSHQNNTPKKIRSREAFDYLGDEMSIAETIEQLNTIEKIANFYFHSAKYGTNEERTIPEFLAEREGVCRHFALAEAALLVENGYPESYYLSYNGHAVTMSFDPYSKKWYDMEYSIVHRLATEKQDLSAEEAAAAITNIRKSGGDYFRLIKPYKGMIYEDLNWGDDEMWNKLDYHYDIDGLLSGKAKLIPETGVKSTIGDRFLE